VPPPRAAPDIPLHESIVSTDPVPKRGHDDEAAFLAAYDPRAFSPVALTADICLLTVRDGLLAILLIERAGHPFKGRWALPGGFVREFEDATGAAWRELSEETGLGQLPGGIHLEQLRTYTAPGRDPRMRVVSVAHVAFAPDLPDPEAGSDATQARWWPVDDLEGTDAPPLAFDHAAIVHDAVERARAKLEYTTLATAFCDEPFTLADLQRTYEAVWGRPLSRQAFQKRVLSAAGFVVEEGGTAPTGGRPAKLYRRGDRTFLPTPILRPETDR
jgi:8-oxo-dGTP diphosphatase